MPRVLPEGGPAPSLSLHPPTLPSSDVLSLPPSPPSQGSLIDLLYKKNRSGEYEKLPRMPTARVLEVFESVAAAISRMHALTPPVGRTATSIYPSNPNLEPGPKLDPQPECMR